MVSGKTKNPKHMFKKAKPAAAKNGALAENSPKTPPNKGPRTNPMPNAAPIRPKFCDFSLQFLEVLHRPVEELVLRAEEHGEELGLRAPTRVRAPRAARGPAVGRFRWDSNGFHYRVGCSDKLSSTGRSFESRRANHIAKNNVQILNTY